MLLIMSDRLRQRFSVPFEFDIVFTRRLFDADNPAFRESLTELPHHAVSRFLCVIDQGVAECHPNLAADIAAYANARNKAIAQAGEPIVIPGGEACKNDPRWLDDIRRQIDARSICRHSYIVAIGGGAILDLVGFAAATAHRGVRHIRVPTTTLAQADSAVGVKNGVNACGKKNFVGSFAPPTAVLMDSTFLTTLEDRDWRSGIAEAIKVALLQDAAFFDWIESSARALASRDLSAMEKLIRRSAELHADHITTSGDPFELASSRPLDFGHWAAHKLEQLTNYQLRHGEAVAIGLALDLTYSHLVGLLDERSLHRAIDALESAGFSLFSPMLINANGGADSGVSVDLLAGLNEFREHLGGELTIMLLESVGSGVETHTMNHQLIDHAVGALVRRAKAKQESGS